MCCDCNAEDVMMQEREGRRGMHGITVVMFDMHSEQVRTYEHQSERSRCRCDRGCHKSSKLDAQL